MNLRKMVAFAPFGLIFTMSRAQAGSVVFDFNGTGFDFAFGAWGKYRAGF